MKQTWSWMVFMAVAAACSTPAFAQRGGWDRNRDFHGHSHTDRNLDPVRRPYVYEFGKKDHIERLAAELYREANSICWEMHRYYQHNTDYRITYAEMYRIRESARRVDDMVNDNYHRRRHTEDRIVRELHEMDDLFHHVEDDVVHWRPDSRRAFRGGDLHDNMDELEETLHHLMEDYGIKSRFNLPRSGARWRVPRRP